MRPDADLAAPGGPDRRGHRPRPTRTSQIDTERGQPGAGLVGETIQFHGTADRYDLGRRHRGPGHACGRRVDRHDQPGRHAAQRRVRTAGRWPPSPTTSPARSSTPARGTRPGPATSATASSPPILRSDDLFFPDWVDLTKVQIPQADEQQRLLANLIEQVNRDVMPLPRFWYFPRGEKAVVVMTGDDHAGNGTPGQFDWAIGSQPARLRRRRVGVRARHLVHVPEHADQRRRGRRLRGPGLRAGPPRQHRTAPTGRRASWRASTTTSWPTFAAAFPSLAAPSTNRTHCITWSDWATQPKVELANGIRLDTNYYYWPAAWVQDRPGYFTGSGMPMRFADLDGSLIDVYQAATQMTDESGMDYALPHQHPARQRPRRRRATTAPSPPTCTPTTATTPGSRRSSTPRWPGACRWCRPARC